MHEQVEGGFGAWYRRHRWWADPLGMALLSVVMAWFGFRGIWGPFSILQEAVSPWWSLALALPACALALVKGETGSRRPGRSSSAVSAMSWS